MAQATATFCKWVLGKPRYRDRRGPTERTPCENVPSIHVTDGGNNVCGVRPHIAALSNQSGLLALVQYLLEQQRLCFFPL
jgi:hypothetical protein